MFEVRLSHFDIQFLIPHNGHLHQLVVSLFASRAGNFHESCNLLPCVAAALQTEEHIVIIGCPLTNGAILRCGPSFGLLVSKDLETPYVDSNFTSGHSC